MELASGLGQLGPAMGPGASLRASRSPQALVTAARALLVKNKDSCITCISFLA